MIGQRDSKIITGACDLYPPYVDFDQPGYGLSIEIITAAYKVSGYEFKLDLLPWARAEIVVNNSEYDILPDAWFTNERAETLLFSDPYAVNELLFIKRKGDFKC
ncbi:MULTISPECIES: transporter substrate-binding domain-containing protein [unclassified Fusibacter]|uniref:transporter substrate-binding domain-containing protein n=1 Tax=unclassified Fusibacter TaxID=2624464 RepID=UPI00101186B7|nr:transporter substrate-binding domain-containing protein [Fusibacter sp. A1]MCK8058233.1 transporter substrate-binding domain-containing protein [Fusibacter sp. A2]NPE20816.1 transporter substrate-binding domain-containing protein [Fusibacter sp. A1]RXV63020.1 hypothetical protein DWB64_03205 [Fusibacter sp. A1]